MQRLSAAAAAAGAAAAMAYVPDARHEVASVAGGALQFLDPETAHSCGITMAKWGLLPRDGRIDDPRLRVRTLGKTFSNPIGVAAGFDKDAEAVEGILGIGVGFMEVGGPLRICPLLLMLSCTCDMHVQSALSCDVVMRTGLKALRCPAAAHGSPANVHGDCPPAATFWLRQVALQSVARFRHADLGPHSSTAQVTMFSHACAKQTGLTQTLPDPAGSITPEPQPGNPTPRCFRLPEQRAIVNRMGFNSGGSAAAERRLAAYVRRRRGGAADTSKVRMPRLSSLGRRGCTRQRLPSARCAVGLTCVCVDGARLQRYW